MGADITPSDRAILIAGPTASGKSGLALALAERFGGVVINADSMQVYRDLRILTARPSEAEMARAPHRLFGHVDAAEAYSVGRWLEDVRIALDEARRAGRRPIIVGGTGLYLQALTRGISAIPSVPNEVRERVRKNAEGWTAEALHDLLTTRDPLTAARLKPTDPQRVLRALEVWEATGTSLVTFQQQRSRPMLDQTKADGFFLQIGRADLLGRIAARFHSMLAQGAMAEVEALADRGLSPVLPAMRALGVPPLLAHMNGEIDLETATARSTSAISKYAKRQLTFARHQLPAFRWLGTHTGEETSSLIAGMSL